MINPQQFNQKDNHSIYIFQRFYINSLIFQAGTCLKKTLLHENMMLTFDVSFFAKNWYIARISENLIIQGRKYSLFLPFYTFVTFFNYQITFSNIRSNSEWYRMHEISSITRLFIALCSSLSPVIEFGDHFKSNLKTWYQQQTRSNLEKLIICIIRNRLKFVAVMASKHEK